jgi:hypothetical protein
MAQQSVYACRAWCDGHITPWDRLHPTSSWGSTARPFLPSVFLVAWYHTRHRMSVRFFEVIRSSNPFQHYIAPCPTCQRRVPRIWIRSMRPCGFLESPPVSTFRRPWFWLDFQKRRQPMRPCAGWYDKVGFGDNEDEDDEDSNDGNDKDVGRGRGRWMMRD